MAEAPEDEATEVTPPPAAPSLAVRLRGHLSGGLRALFGLVPKVALLLFMLALPLALVAYPAYRMTGRLLDYSAASTVEAKLTDIDIRTVELGQDQTTLFEARRHYDVVFYLDGPKGQKYASAVEMSWPAPGLKRRLENQYPVGDAFTLYLMPDHAIELSDAVAKDAIYRLSGLMGLVFVAFAIFFMLWKRLSGRMPAIMPRFPVAIAKSFMIGQSVALAISGLLAVLLSFAPIALISAELYVSAYWGVTLVISLMLRLLVFSNPPQAAAATPEAPVDTRKVRAAAPPRK